MTHPIYNYIQLNPIIYNCIYYLILCLIIYKKLPGIIKVKLFPVFFIFFSTVKKYILIYNNISVVCFEKINVNKTIDLTPIKLYIKYVFHKFYKKHIYI